MIVSYYILNRGEELAILTNDNDFIVFVKVDTHSRRCTLLCEIHVN